MNKTSLIVATEEQTGQGIAATALAVDAMLRALVHTLASGERVQLPGLGVIEPDVRAARTMRNPSTGDPVDVPAKWVFRFRPASRLSEYANTSVLPDTPAEVALTGTRPEPRAKAE
jgi:DNA-binding protein HU-beta